MATLDGLAPELLLSISDFLPPVDLYCFSFCNHRLYLLFSRQIKKLPPLAPGKKFLILTRLERDIPPYFACRACNVLHRYDGSERFGLSGFHRERSCSLPSIQLCPRSEPWFWPYYILVIHRRKEYCIRKFSFLHLKLAMRRFYYGPEAGISTDSLSHTQVTESRSWPARNEVIWLVSRDARICTKPLGLYVRIQDILLSSEWGYILDEPHPRHCDPLMLCPHDTGLQAIALILRPPGNREKGFPEVKEISGNCDICNTVYLIELSEIDSKKALVITRWVNLGRGLDDNDPMWNSHTHANYGHHYRYCGFDPHYPVEAQSPRRRFEETAPQSFKDLRFRNLSYLKDRQYRRIMCYSYGWSTWHSPFREPSTNMLVNFGRSFLAFWGIFPDALSD